MRTCMCLCMRMCLCSCMCACMHTARGVPVRCHCGSVGSAALHWCTVGPAAWWQVEWYLAKANAYPEVRRKKAAAQVALAKHPNPNPHANPNPNPNPNPHPDQVALAKHRLYRADLAAKQIGGAAHHCCGQVFVTFDTVEAARACIEAGRVGHKYYQGFGPLEMRAAPEAEDVIWENLQCSRWERGFRSLVALLAALAAVTASTAAITYSSLQQTSLMYRGGCNHAPRLQPRQPHKRCLGAA